MKLSSLDLLNFQPDLADIRANSRLVYGCQPVLVKQNFDQDTQSGNDMTDGNGTGLAANDWHIYAFRVHFRNVDSMLMTYGHVPPGVIMGDLLVNYGLRDHPSFTQLFDDKYSYLLIDGLTYQIISLVAEGLGLINEYVADARAFTPLFRANGY